MAVPASPVEADPTIAACYRNCAFATVAECHKRLIKRFGLNKLTLDADEFAFVFEPLLESPGPIFAALEVGVVRGRAGFGAAPHASPPRVARRPRPRGREDRRRKSVTPHGGRRAAVASQSVHRPESAPDHVVGRARLRTPSRVGRSIVLSLLRRTTRNPPSPQQVRKKGKCSTLEALAAQVGRALLSPRLSSGWYHDRSGQPV